jgi:hypothetical protein
MRINKETLRIYAKYTGLSFQYVDEDLKAAFFQKRDKV